MYFNSFFSLSQWPIFPKKGMFRFAKPANSKYFCNKENIRLRHRRERASK